jgi:hypothetical protein
MKMSLLQLQLDCTGRQPRPLISCRCRDQVPRRGVLPEREKYRKFSEEF